MFRKVCLVSMVLLVTSAYASELGKEQALYDFDHKIHYRQTKLSGTTYRLSVREGNYAQFAIQSTFLLRHSARLCKSEQFSLSFESGVQKFETFPTEPRANPGPLVAVLTCLKN